MDSGAIASTLGHLTTTHPTTTPIHTYSWAFDSLPECDERHVSEPHARHFGFGVHHVSADDFPPLAAYPEHGPHRDEPMVGVYQPLIERSLAAAQADGVGVMLSGDRGDLIDGAWTLYYPRMLRTRQWRDMAHEIREHVHATDEGLPLVAWRYLVQPLVAEALRGGPTSVTQRLGRRVGAAFGGRGRSSEATTTAEADWLPAAPTPESVADDPIREQIDGFARRRRYDMVFMPLHMRGVIWSERTYARFGQAFADPWSDVRLAQFVMAVPQQVINRPGHLDKRLVRTAMRELMPASVLAASGKVLPSPLYRRALRGSAEPVVTDLLTNMQLAQRGFVDETRLRAHYAAVGAGGREKPSLWWCLAAEMWLRRYWQ
jgi:asparagine synthase (glutamine-hydrolysing)